MTHKLLASAGIAALVLAGCEEAAGPVTEETQAPVEAETAVPGVQGITVAITLGTFEGEVSDLAAIEAYPLGFQSRILAANGEAGVQMIQVDGEYLGVLSPVLRERGRQASLLAPSYAFGEEGRVLQFVSEPDGLSRIDLVRLDVGFAEPERSWSIDENLVDLCVSGTTGIVVTDTGEVGRFEVSPDAPRGAPVRMVDGVRGATRCLATRSGLFVSTGSAMLDLTAAAPTASSLDPAVIAIAETPEGSVGVMIGNGQLVIDGTALQVTDEDGVVILPRKILVEGGNFGGILRDGVVAILGEDNRLHLAAWSTLANAADVPRTAVTRRRDEVLGESDLSVGENLDALRPRRESPGFEEPALPEPPSDPRR